MPLPAAPAQDRAALLRSTTAQILAAAGTLAGTAVEEERIDPIEPGDTPRIVIFCDQSGDTDSQAGTNPRFKVTANLTIQAITQRARQADVLADLDTMVAQIKYALFCNPAWIALTQTIATFRVASSFKTGGDYVTGDARLQLTLTWFESYEPDITTPFSTIRVTTTLAAGTAPILSSYTLGG